MTLIILPRNQSLHRTRGDSLDEVAGALRQAGVRRIDEVAYGIFEPTGSISLLRTGLEVDPQLLSGVVVPTGPARPWYRL